MVSSIIGIKMKEKFRNKRFSENLRIKLSNGQYWEANTFGLIAAIIKVIEKYHDKGIRMTLRQLYYQLVAADIIPNDDRVYKKLSTLLADSRYVGIVDWEAIEDRVRVPRVPGEWNSIPEIVKSAIKNFRLPRWAEQDYYIELLTEKDALSSILAPIAHKWHVTFCVNRGYTSATAMYDMFRRVFKKVKKGKKAILLYLGDHDPSGLDMIRDIELRLQEFLVVKGIPVNKDGYVVPIALTKKQIKKYNPPPNPAKITDPRAKWYISQFGNKSWEVDALPPDVMMGLVEKKIRNYIDMEQWDSIISEEKGQKKKLQNILKETDWDAG
jgi:hypothetical protein